MKQLSLVVILFLFFSKTIFSQNNPDSSLHNRVYLFEFTSIYIENNVKLAYDCKFYQLKNLEFHLQPGFEYLSQTGPIGGGDNPYGIHPFYDLNLLFAARILSSYPFSIKPFLGGVFRSMDFKRNTFDIKYGATMNLLISRRLSIASKIMKLTMREEHRPFIGIGFEIAVNTP